MTGAPALMVAFEERSAVVTKAVADLLERLGESPIVMTNLAVVAAAAEFLNDDALAEVISAIPPVRSSLRLNAPNTEAISEVFAAALPRYSHEKRVDIVTDFIAQTTLATVKKTPAELRSPTVDAFIAFNDKYKNPNGLPLAHFMDLAEAKDPNTPRTRVLELIRRGPEFEEAAGPNPALTTQDIDTLAAAGISVQALGKNPNASTDVADRALLSGGDEVNWDLQAIGNFSPELLTDILTLQLGMRGTTETVNERGSVTTHFSEPIVRLHPRYILDNPNLTGEFLMQALQSPFVMSMYSPYILSHPNLPVSEAESRLQKYFDREEAVPSQIGESTEQTVVTLAGHPKLSPAWRERIYGLGPQQQAALDRELGLPDARNEINWWALQCLPLADDLVQIVVPVSPLDPPDGTPLRIMEWMAEKGILRDIDLDALSARGDELSTWVACSANTGGRGVEPAANVFAAESKRALKAGIYQFPPEGSVTGWASMPNRSDIPRDLPRGVAANSVLTIGGFEFRLIKTERHLQQLPPAVAGAIGSVSNRTLPVVGISSEGRVLAARIVVRDIPDDPLMDDWITDCSSAVHPDRFTKADELSPMGPELSAIHRVLVNVFFGRPTVEVPYGTNL